MITKAARQVKLLGYAYPSSTTAEKHGFDDVGCWLVDIADCHCEFDHETIAVYGDKAQAVEHLQRISLPLGKYSQSLAMIE